MSTNTLPTCYRHPDRETRVACASCGRPACVECLQRAATGPRCQDCAAAAEVTTTERQVPAAPPPQASAPVAFTFLGASVAIHALTLVAPTVWEALFLRGAQINAAVAAGEWYRLVSAAFLHSEAGLTHILFNMFALYLFGPQIERQAGSVPFAALYLASAVAGGAAFFVLNPAGIAVGASGAIFGLFGAWLAASVRTRHTPAGRAGLRQLLFLLAINLALPLFVPRIAWEAHLGGLVAGFVIALVWFPLARTARAHVLRTLVAAGVGVGALALAAAA